MVVPAVVQEGDAVVDGAADNLDALLLLLLTADVVAAQPDDRDLFAGTTQRPVAHGAADRFLGPGQLALGPLFGRVRTGTQKVLGRSGDPGSSRHRHQELTTLHGRSSFPGF